MPGISPGFSCSTQRDNQKFREFCCESRSGRPSSMVGYLSISKGLRSVLFRSRNIKPIIASGGSGRSRTRCGLIVVVIVMSRYPWG